MVLGLSLLVNRWKPWIMGEVCQTDIQEVRTAYIVLSTCITVSTSLSGRIPVRSLTAEETSDMIDNCGKSEKPEHVIHQTTATRTSICLHIRSRPGPETAACHLHDRCIPQPENKTWCCVVHPWHRKLIPMTDRVLTRTVIFSRLPSPWAPNREKLAGQGRNSLCTS